MKSKIVAPAIIIFTVVLAFYSCAKIEPTDLGGALLPAVDNVNTFETVLDVITDNFIFDDTTRMLYNEPHALGIIENDLEFGNTSAAIYSSFTPTSYKIYPFVRDTIVIDSVVLSMACTSVYGDSNCTQQFEVREMNPIFPFADSLYYLGAPDFNVRPEVLGSASVTLKTLNDSVFYRNGRDTIRSSAELRIHLDTAWARRFVNYDTSGAYNNDSAFKERFKGLEIRPSESGSLSKKGLAYFNLGDNSRTRITFYCRGQNNGKTDTLAPYFTYTTDPHANIIRRTPGNNYLANINNGNPNDEKLYIQSAPGSYATVKIPGIDTLNNRIVHRAELIIEKHPSEEDFYIPPAVMFIDVINNTGDSAFTIRNDYVPDNASLAAYDVVGLGGLYSKSRYVFNLTRYTQSIVTKGFPNYTLRVYAPYTAQPFYTAPNSDVISYKVAAVPNTPVAAGRVVVYGGGSTDPKRMRLRIIYSKI